MTKFQNKVLNSTTLKKNWNFWGISVQNGYQGLLSDLSPSPLRSNFPKNKGDILSVFQIPYRKKKGIFKENRKKFFRFAENKGGDKSDDNPWYRKNVMYLWIYIAYQDKFWNITLPCVSSLSPPLEFKIETSGRVKFPSFLTLIWWHCRKLFFFEILSGTHFPQYAHFVFAWIYTLSILPWYTFSQWKWHRKVIISASFRSGVKNFFPDG